MIQLSKKYYVKKMSDKILYVDPLGLADFDEYSDFLWDVRRIIRGRQGVNWSKDQHLLVAANNVQLKVGPTESFNKEIPYNILNNIPLDAWVIKISDYVEVFG